MSVSPETVLNEIAELNTEKMECVLPDTILLGVGFLFFGLDGAAKRFPPEAVFENQDA